LSNRIILIHALADSVQPIHEAFDRLWPEADRFDLLDTSLSADLAAAGELTSSIRDRFLVLGQYAAQYAGVGGKTAGILFTCSAFGPAIDAVKAALSMPTLKPNESAFAAALVAGRRIGLLVTFLPSLAALSCELKDLAVQTGQSIELDAKFVEGALAALKAGDTATHDRLIAEAAAAMPDRDVIVLGQFSMARAADRIRTSSGRQVITTPDAAVLDLRQRVIDRL
jgi:Asp/Glu/hydantoin racemase